MTHPVRDQTWPDDPGLIEPGRVHGSLHTDPRVFADGSVEVDTTANGPRLRLPEGHLTQLLDPSADRWRDT